MKGKFLFLGTGGSMGVPVIGCMCEVCQSSLAQNKRLRSSGLLIVGEIKLLIDVGPDFRQVALKHKINHLSGVMLTHAHADHIGGIDDLRAFYFSQKGKIPCLLSKETFDLVCKRFDYMMHPIVEGKSVPAQVDFKLLAADFGDIDFEGVPIQYLSYEQMGMKVTGFRVGNFAYVSDIRTYTDQVFTSLEGVEILVLSALRKTPSAMHFSLSEAIDFALRVGAKKTYLTHIAHDLDHETTNALLPEGFSLSYDGLEIEITL